MSHCTKVYMYWKIYLVSQLELMFYSCNLVGMTINTKITHVRIMLSAESFLMLIPITYMENIVLIWIH